MNEIVPIQVISAFVSDILDEMQHNLLAFSSATRRRIEFANSKEHEGVTPKQHKAMLAASYQDARAIRQSLVQMIGNMDMLLQEPDMKQFDTATRQEMEQHFDQWRDMLMRFAALEFKRQGIDFMEITPAEWHEKVCNADRAMYHVKQAKEYVKKAQDNFVDNPDTQA